MHQRVQVHVGVEENELEERFWKSRDPRTRGESLRGLDATHWCCARVQGGRGFVRHPAAADESDHVLHKHFALSCCKL